MFALYTQIKGLTDCLHQVLGTHVQGHICSVYITCRLNEQVGLQCEAGAKALEKQLMIKLTMSLPLDTQLLLCMLHIVWACRYQYWLTMIHVTQAHIPL